MYAKAFLLLATTLIPASALKMTGGQEAWPPLTANPYLAGIAKSIESVLYPDEQKPCADDFEGAKKVALVVGAEIDSCSDLKVFCNMEGQGAAIQQQCPFTCGLCEERENARQMKRKRIEEHAEKLSTLRDIKETLPLAQGQNPRDEWFVKEVWDVTNGFRNIWNLSKGSMDLSRFNVIKERIEKVSRFVEKDDLGSAEKHEAFIAQVIKTGKGCDCYNWADVYKHHGVHCGQAFEMQSTIGLSGDYILKSDAPFIANTTPDYWTFCTDFFTKLNANYCVNQRFMPRKALYEPWNVDRDSVGTWCYTSAECPMLSRKIPGTDVGVKVCNPINKEDTNLRELPVEEVVKLGKELQLDQGMLAGFAYAWKGDGGAKAIAKDLEEVLQLQAAEVGRPMFVVGDYQQETPYYSLDHLATRYVVTTNQVWQHEIDLHAFENVSGHLRMLWNVTCLKGCA